MTERSIEEAPRLLSTAEVAGGLGVAQTTVVDWCRSDKVPYVRLPGPRGQYRIPVDELVATLDGITEEELLQRIDEASGSEPASE